MELRHLRRRKLTNFHVCHLQGVDVVVGTPGRINELMTKGALRLDQCRAVVLDEVDILLGGPLSSFLTCSSASSCIVPPIALCRPFPQQASQQSRQPEASAG